MTSSRLSHMPSLDGVRGAALIAVLLFHSRFGWARGGFLGVTTFFVLSGFLITGLLLREKDTSGTIRLRDFWERRARRLAPALLVLLVVVVVYVRFATVQPPRGVVGDAVASMLWFANWRFVFAEHSYADIFSTASPFEHMWSLAIEEQVYLVLPILALLLLGRRRGSARRWLLAAALSAVVVASTVAAAMLRTPGAAPLHEYYGTDARAAEPVVGALLALALVRPGGLVELRRVPRALLDVAGIASAAGLLVLFAQMSQRSDSLYQGGLLLTASLSAVVVAAATQPRGVVSTALSFEPLAALGRVSYGAYLFHWPIFLWLTPARTGLDEPRLLLLRFAVTVALAVTSYHLVEMPVRAGVLPVRIGVPSWANASVGLVAVLALTTMTATATPTMFAGSAAPPEPPPLAAPQPARSGQVRGPVVGLNANGSAPSAQPRPGGMTEKTAGPPDPADAPPVWDGSHPDPLRVAIIGDSMAWNLAQGLKEWASYRGDVVTYSLAAPGCPISRGGTRRSPAGEDWPVHEDCSWWAEPYSDRAKYLRMFSPDVIVVQDAMNELPDRKLPEWREYRHTGQPEFDQWLLSEYSEMIDTVAGDNTKVLFLNAVCVDWALLGDGHEDYAKDGEGDRRVRTLRATAGALAPTGARVADFYAHLCPNGEFTQTVDGVDNARPDGYHLSDEASLAVVENWLGPMVLEAAQGVPPLAP